MAAKKRKAEDQNMVSACGGQRIPDLEAPPKKKDAGKDKTKKTTDKKKK